AAAKWLVVTLEPPAGSRIVAAGVALEHVDEAGQAFDRRIVEIHAETLHVVIAGDQDAGQVAAGGNTGERDLLRAKGLAHGHHGWSARAAVIGREGLESLAAFGCGID